MAQGSTQKTDQGTQQERAHALLREHGTTYADEAGVTLRDEPSPLYQLLVLTTLSATRISAEIAVAAARELFAAGWRTPEKMREARSEEHTSELQSLMRLSYAVFCLKKQIRTSTPIQPRQ